MLFSIFIVLSVLCLLTSLFIFYKAIVTAKKRIYVVNSVLNNNTGTLSEKESESIYTIINSNVLVSLINVKTKEVMTYINSFPCIIGRSADISIINDQSISRRHIIFTYENRNIYIEDLKSTNGTLVNGQRISSKQKVNSRDKISIGDTEFLIDIIPINDEKIDNGEI